MGDPASHLPDRGEASDDHCPNPDEAHLGGPDLPGGVERGEAGLEPSEQGQGDEPAQGATDEHQNGDLEPDDVADGDERGTHVGPKVENRPSGAERGFHRGLHDAHAAHQQLEECAHEHAQADAACPAATAFSRCQHLGARHALRVPKVRPLDDERLPHRHHEDDTQQPPEQRDEGGWPEFELLPCPDEQQRRDSEDHPGRERLSGRGHGLHHIVFEDRRPPEQRAKQRHAHDRGRNGCGDRQARVEPEVHVGRAHDDAEDGAKGDRDPGQLSRGLARRNDRIRMGGRFLQRA